jgi:glycerol-3-phosphate dehydrogenase
VEAGLDGRMYDVAIIGAGVVGSAIARELSQYDVSVAILDAATDVGTGTSKANTAILHTGFDAMPGSLEARLVTRGAELLRAYAASAGIPIERTGAIVVAWTDEEASALDGIQERARANGYAETRRIDREELYRTEPSLGPGATAALEIPDESVVCTFSTPIAFATEAVMNGVQLMLDSALTGVTRTDGGDHRLEIEGRPSITARWVVNASGLYADVVDGFFGHRRFTITPRRGELLVFDKPARGLVGRIVLPVPTMRGKGVLVAPTVYGNVLVGPTSVDVSDRTATQSTRAGIADLRAHAERIVPRILDEEVTAVYSGLRAATEHPDYQITAEGDQRYVCVGGIRSTGLTASMAIGEYVVGLMRDCGLQLRRVDGHVSIRVPQLGEASVRPYQDAAAIERDPWYGQVVCHCERVTMGELRDAMRSPIPARDLDGLRRRTRVQMGRCQGFYCAAEVASILRAGAPSAPTE